MRPDQINDLMNPGYLPLESGVADSRKWAILPTFCPSSTGRFPCRIDDAQTDFQTVPDPWTNQINPNGSKTVSPDTPISMGENMTSGSTVSRRRFIKTGSLFVAAPAILRATRASAQDKVFKIGLVSPLTGPLAGFGEAQD